MSKTYASFASPHSPAGELFISRAGASIIECASIPLSCHALPRVGHATFHVTIPAAIAIAITIAVTITIAFTVAATVTTITTTMTTTKMPHDDGHCPVAVVLLLQLESPLPSLPPLLHPHRLYHLRCHGTLATITAIPAAAPLPPPLPSLPPQHHCLCHPCCHDTIASAISAATTPSPPPLQSSPRHHAVIDAALRTAISQCWRF